MDLQSEHERWLTEEHIGRPVVVMNYPKDIKAFYMRMNDDGNRRGDGRAGARHRRDHRRLTTRGAPRRPRRPLDEMSWTRLTTGGTRPTKVRHCPPAGFGLARAHLIYATGMANVRDVIRFPARRKTRRFSSHAETRRWDRIISAPASLRENLYREIAAYVSVSPVSRWCFRGDES